MELDAVDLALVVLENGHRCPGRRGRGDESVRELGDPVEMAHPTLVGVRGIGWQNRRVAGALEQRAPVLAGHAAADDAAELLGDQLRAVADAEDRDPELVDADVELRRALDVHARRATRQDDRVGRPLGDLGGRDPVRHDLGVHVQLADSPGDQLCVLGAEVDDEHRGTIGVPRRIRCGIGRGLRLTHLMDRRGPARLILALFVALVSILGPATARRPASSTPGQRRAALDHPARRRTGEPARRTDERARGRSPDPDGFGLLPGGQQPQRLPRTGRATRLRK